MTYEDHTKSDLQQELRARELPTSGSKQELIDRLAAAERDRLLGLRRDDLRAELRERGLSVAGTKDELVERLAAADATDTADDATGTVEDLVEPVVERGEEVYENLATAAQQLVGSLTERGVPVDRIFSAFRSAGQSLARQVGENDQGVDLATDEADAPTQEDRNIIERLISVFSEVVDQGRDTASEAQVAAEDTAEATFGTVGEAVDELDDRAADVADATEAAGTGLREGAARLRAASGAQGPSVEASTDDLAGTFVAAFEDAAGSDEDADETERLVNALRDRGVLLEGEREGLIDRIVAAFELTADAMRAQALEAPAASAGGTEQARERDEGRSTGGGVGERLQLVRRAAQQLEPLSGRRVDGVSGLRPEDDGWRIALELVEMARLPPAADVLGSYEVIVDGDGDLLRYERVKRYIRGQAGQEAT